MISDLRLSVLVGHIRAVDYRLAAKQDLASQMAAKADEYGELALLPEGSALEAAESTDTAATISRLNDEEQTRLAEEIKSLEQEKSRLLHQIYEEGMQTGRWIGVGDRYVHLSGSDSTSSELRLHDIPRGRNYYILTDEDPEITARRVNYAAYYDSARRQLAGIFGLMFSVFFVASYTPLLQAWLALVGVIVVVGASATVFRQGAQMALRRFGPFESVNSPWLEVMPDSGERFDLSRESLSSEENTQDEASHGPSQGLCPANAARRSVKSDECRRACAYAEIEATRAEIEAERRAREKRGNKKR